MARAKRSQQFLLFVVAYGTNNKSKISEHTWLKDCVQNRRQPYRRGRVRYLPYLTNVTDRTRYKPETKQAGARHPESEIKMNNKKYGPPRRWFNKNYVCSRTAHTHTHQRARRFVGVTIELYSAPARRVCEVQSGVGWWSTRTHTTHKHTHAHKS